MLRALLFSLAVLAAPTGPLLAESDELVVKVSDPAAGADALVAAVEALGGYFSSRSDDAVGLKVPQAMRDELLAKVTSLGIVVAKHHEARDLAGLLEEWRTRLQSRENVLQRYYAVIGEAGPTAVVTVEREMTALVQAIEQQKGQIRLAEHQLAYAEVTVRFQFRDRTPPARDGSSSFEWLNTVNLQDLVGEFSHEE
jgi:hypothetical protein